MKVDLPTRLTPSQYVAKRVGEDSETICALLSDIEVLKAAWNDPEALKARIAELEALQRPSAGQQPGDNVEQAPQC